jgi:hypothetical protein
MCPGGTVVAATSEAGRVVTNGMSQYSRNERNANAGIVVGITPLDYPGGPLAGIALQRDLEARAFELGGGSYEAPAQLVGDFLAGRPSTRLGAVIPSYQPGVRLTDLASALPDYAIAALREALPAFDRQIRGFAMPDAVLTGVETRTSSPLRITSRRRLSERQCPRSLSCRRRCRLRWRHPLGRGRWHQGCRGGDAATARERVRRPIVRGSLAGEAFFRRRRRMMRQYQTIMYCYDCPMRLALYFGRGTLTPMPQENHTA